MTSRLTRAWLLADVRRRLARRPDPERSLGALRRHAASRSPHHADALAGRWRVVHGGAEITVEVVGPRADFSEQGVVDALRSALCEVTGAPVPVSVAVVDGLPAGPAGKAARIVDEG